VGCDDKVVGESRARLLAAMPAEMRSRQYCISSSAAYSHNVRPGDGAVGSLPSRRRQTNIHRMCLRTIASSLPIVVGMIQKIGSINFGKPWKHDRKALPRNGPPDDRMS
jgi:hypothetical protein